MSVSVSFFGRLCNKEVDDLTIHYNVYLYILHKEMHINLLYDISNVVFKDNRNKTFPSRYISHCILIKKHCQILQSKYHVGLFNVLG